MLVFLSIGGASALFFVLSLFFGDADADTDHGFDVHHDLDHGGADGHHGHSMSNIFSIRNLFLFGVGFGAVGAVARYYGFSMMVSSVFGTATGFVFAALGYFLFRALYAQQSNSLTTSSSLVNRQAQVTIAIPRGGLGQVVTTNEHGSSRYLSAKATDGESLGVGAVVTIRSIVGDTALVSA